MDPAARTIAYMLVAVMIAAVPVACACYLIYQKLPALLAVRATVASY